MKDKKYLLNTLLAVVLGLALLVLVLVRTFAPMIIMPKFDVVNMVLVSLLALVLDAYFAPGAKRCYVCVAVFSAVSFGLLPFGACFVGAAEAVKLGLVGGVVFTAVTWVYSSMLERISTGPAAKAAPLVSAVGLYLAVQCFMGMF